MHIKCDRMITYMAGEECEWRGWLEEKAVSRNRCSKIKKSKQGREEREWQREAGKKKGKKSQRKSSKNQKPIVS